MTHTLYAHGPAVAVSRQHRSAGREFMAGGACGCVRSEGVGAGDRLGCRRMGAVRRGTQRRRTRRPARLRGRADGCGGGTRPGRRACLSGPSPPACRQSPDGRRPQVGRAGRSRNSGLRGRPSRPGAARRSPAGRPGSARVPRRRRPRQGCRTDGRTGSRPSDAGPHPSPACPLRLLLSMSQQVTTLSGDGTCRSLDDTFHGHSTCRPRRGSPPSLRSRGVGGRRDPWTDSSRYALAE